MTKMSVITQRLLSSSQLDGTMRSRLSASVTRMPHHPPIPWDPATETPMACPMCSGFTVVSVGALLETNRFTCGVCHAEVILEAMTLRQLTEMRGLMEHDP